VEEAITEYREALRLKPDYANAHNGLGNALDDRGKPAEAIAEYRQALRIKPDDPLVRTNLGDALSDQGKVEEAITEYREALRLKPDYANAHNGLGNALDDQGKPAEAIAEYREALRLKPNHPQAHYNLGSTLKDQGKVEESIAEYREALRLKPDYSEAHYNLGNALKAQGKLDEAIAEYRAAIRLKPDDAEAHCNLGHVLREQGKYAESLSALRTGHALGSKRPGWPYPSADWVRQVEQLVTLADRLPALLRGDEKPKDNAERLALAQMRSDTKQFAAAARLWAEALESDPKLADNLQAGNRYNAACAAARAGSGQGKDEPPLDEAARTRWRKQAIDWLKADLAAWSKTLGGGLDQARQVVSLILQHWKADPDLAGLREPEALARLPKDEQKACRALWAEVDGLLAKTRQKTPR
jgi:Flp pilus assembly protein TadD